MAHHPSSVVVGVMLTGGLVVVSSALARGTPLEESASVICLFAGVAAMDAYERLTSDGDSAMRTLVVGVACFVAAVVGMSVGAFSFHGSEFKATALVVGMYVGYALMRLVLALSLGQSSPEQASIKSVGLESGLVGLFLLTVSSISWRTTYQNAAVTVAIIAGMIIARWWCHRQLLRKASASDQRDTASYREWGGEK